jgi:uncharacterized phiE125 gp8 family phage protein
MAIEVTTAPAAEPLTTAEAKAHLRVDLADEDALIDAAIIAARTYIENFTRLKLITQTVTLTRTGWSGRTLPLPVGPVQSIDRVRYKSSVDGSLIEWDAANYQLVRTARPQALAPAYGKTWPTPRSDYDNVEVRFVAGFGDASTDVPYDILAACRLLTAHFYENRQNELAGNIISKLTLGADRLLMPHVLHI